MQRTITMHTVDFEVEFDESGEVDALYIGAVEVTEVISDITKDAIRSTVERNAARWFDEYRAEMAGDMRRAA
ncbi:MAG: hypothetical protein WA049_20160 [Ferribacterium limneticum]